MKKIIALLFLPVVSFAQDNDLLKELEKENKDTGYTIATFKGTRLVNGHSVETKNAGTLEFIFAHRFGRVNDGLYEMYGLDQAYVRLGLDYGITDNLSVSIGRNSADKIMDGYLKYKLLRQSTGEKNFPVTVTVLGGTAYSISPKRDNEPEGFKTVDLQIMPTYIHKNAVDQSKEKNDQLAIGVGGRIKITRSVALTSEYYYRLDAPDNDLFDEGSKRYNSVGFGVDIETGGHVFQLVLTNTSSLTERTFITETKGDFFDGDIHLGFNVTRTFQLKKKK
jgi:hypothetical protein